MPEGFEALEKAADPALELGSRPELRNLSLHQFVVVHLFGILFGAYALILTGWFTPLGMLGLTVVMGVGMAGIGFSVSPAGRHRGRAGDRGSTGS